MFQKPVVLTNSPCSLQGISYRQFKPLCLQFSNFKRLSSFPQQWKVVCMSPLYKKGSPSSIMNYGPVCLLNTASKLFERCIYQTLFNHFQSFLTWEQHGFVRRKSTVTNLLEFLRQIYSAIGKDEYVTAVYTDFAKAFDKVSKHVLLYKLKRIGVSGKLFDIIQSYLSNRKQFVRVDGTCSTILDVISGVPEGSILGPLLFCVLINGLPEHIVHCYVPMFANDIKLLICDSLSSGQLKLNSEFQSLSSSCDNIQMILAHGKCVCLNFMNTSTSVLIGGQHLAPTEHTKDLGLTKSTDLKWNEHIVHKVSKANKVFCMIKRNVSAQLSTHKRLCLYKSTILPIISYASPCFYINNSQIRKIESLQNRVVKWILFYANISYTESLIKLNLLPLNVYLQLNDLLVLARICLGKYETTLSSFFHFTQRRGH